ncbi:hypothetical protein [Chitinophaga sp. MM2321]
MSFLLIAVSSGGFGNSGSCGGFGGDGGLGSATWKAVLAGELIYGLFP